MKKRTSISWAALFALAFLLGACSEKAPDISSPEGSTRFVFHSLQKGDFEALKMALPNLTDLHENYDKAVEKLGVTEEWDDKKMEGAVQQIESQQRKLWDEVRVAGEKEGIVWASAEEKSLKISRNEFVDRYLANVADVVLAFQSEGKDYVLEVGVVEYSRGWLFAKLSLGK